MLNSYDRAATPIIHVWKDWVVEGIAYLEAIIDRGDRMCRVVHRQRIPIQEYPGDLYPSA